MWRRREIAAMFLGSVALVGCSSSARTSTPAAPTTPAKTSRGATETSGASTASVRPGGFPKVCGNPGPVPKRYRSVVVFAFENRTWSSVGIGFGSGMPFLHRLGRHCAYFADWTETDTKQNSLTQYVGQLTGASQPGTINDCAPSTSCSTRSDNLFRQARRAGLTAINYVEGATSACSADGNAAKHIPDLYMWGPNDRSHCRDQVRPLSDLNPNRLPSFSFMTPTSCDDGHDCANTTVDRWAKTHIQPILDSVAYRAGNVSVFVWYDEDHPVPNMWITPTSESGARTAKGASYAGTLSAWESMLGLPCLANACTATNMRAAAHA